MKYKNSFALIIILLLSRFTSGQSFTHVDYQGIDSVICNPERGFYHFSEASSIGNFHNLNLNTLLGYRAEGITLMFRYFYLENFTASDISGDYLLNMKKDFEVLRQAGMKVVIRFAYSESMEKPYGDAPIDIVLRHIEQVKPIIRENSDVILVVQAGFVGAWGEWWYTDHYAYSPGVLFPEHWALRRQIVNALLEAVPPTRMVEVRTPKYKQMMLESDLPVTEQEAYSDLPVARIAHHNDCFVSSADDYGTYDDTLVEKQYLEADTRFTMIGGETCNPSPPYSDCPNSLHEMKRFHWTYLNIDYNTQLLNGWRTQGCFTEVEKKLGYRYRLIEADIQDSAAVGGEFSIVFKMINEGWSNPVNFRKAEIIIRLQSTGEEYIYDINEDLRFRPLNEAFILTVNAGIPQGIKEGKYDIFLNLPDPEFSLRSEPKFSIRTANEGTWDSATGLNSLLASFIVADISGLPPYNGTGFFYPARQEIIESAQINIDGMPGDWQNIEPACTAAGQSAEIFKAYNSEDSIYFLIEGHSLHPSYQFFIDADNLSTTGYNAWPWKSNGSDYLIENGMLYKYSGNSGEWSWEFIKEIPASINDTVIETGFPFNDLTDPGPEYNYGVAFVNDPQNVVQTSYLPPADEWFIQVRRLLGHPKEIRCKSPGNNAVAYWPGSADPSVYNVLERSSGGTDYQQVAILKNNSISFTDIDLAENTGYSYRIYRTDGISVSPASPVISITTTEAEPYFIEVVTDGQSADWNIIPPIATGFDGQLNAMRMVNYGDSLFFSLEGPENIDSYSIFLNSDGETGTGLPNNTGQAEGFDFLIRNDTLFRAGSGSWTFAKKTSSARTPGFMEGGLRLEEVELINAGNAYVFSAVNGSSVPDYAPQAEFIKLPQPGVPLYFNVKNSQNNPETRIVIEWARPGNCEGFIIERSVGDSAHFKMLTDLPASETYFHDNTVHPDTFYLYRMFAYSSLNRSAYTESYGGYPGQIFGISEPAFNATSVKVYPNPFTGSAKVEVYMKYPEDVTVEILSVTGKKVSELYRGKAERYNYFDIPEGLLRSGIYFIRVTGPNISRAEKVVVY